MPETPATKFQAVLNELGVSRVICVDDVYNSRADISTILAWASLNKNLPALRSFLKIAGHEIDTASGTLQAELRTILDDDVDAAVSVHALICRQMITKSDQSNQLSESDLQLFTDRSVLHRVDELMDGFAHFQGLSPDQWASQKSATFALLATEKILFIFDESLGEGVQPGTEQILEIAGRQEGANAYFGLLSYNIELGTEHERTRYFQQQNVVATAIAKRALSSASGIEQLQVRLRAAVLWKESKELRETCQDALNIASATAHERVSVLTTLEFDEVVFRSSYYEGVHEMDTLVRIYTNAFAASLREALRSNATALRDIDKLRSFRGTEPEGSDSGSTAWKLQRDEYYDSGVYINSCKMPPEAGDIYRITDQDGKIGEYVLIAPPCDLMVRSTSGERKKGVNSAVLCPIVTDKPADNKLREIFQLDYYSTEDGSSAWVHFAEGLTVDLWLLDLCSINSMGQALRPLNHKIPEHLSQGWKIKCQAALIPKCGELFAAWKAWKALRKTTREGVGVRPAHSIIIDNQLLVRVEFKKSKGEYRLDLGVQRMQRLAPILSTELIRAYGDYISRPARPHSLSLNPNMKS